MKLKKAEEAIEEYRDKYAKELFDKPSGLLDPGENHRLDEYIHDIQNPEWRVIETKHGDKVEISNVGQVRDPETKKLFSPGRPYVSGKPYYEIIDFKSKLTDDHYILKIHRLVAQAFVPNPENKPEVNHIDGHKTHNWYRNLEWVTHGENVKAAYDTNLSPTGENKSTAKHTNDQIRQVCELLQNRPDLSIETISRMTGVTRSSISQISQGKKWVKISKDYVFPKRNGYSKGEDRWNSKYTEAQIRQVCELLRDRPDMTYEQIEGLTSVKPAEIHHVYKGEAWSYVSKDYNFPSRETNASGENNGSAIYTAEQAEQVCKLLDDIYLGNRIMPLSEISKEVGVSQHLVYRIVYGKGWTSISKNHPFYQARFGNKE